MAVFVGVSAGSALHGSEERQRRQQPDAAARRRPQVLRPCQEGGGRHSAGGPPSPPAADHGAHVCLVSTPPPQKKKKGGLHELCHNNAAKGFDWPPECAPIFQPSLPTLVSEAVGSTSGWWGCCHGDGSLVLFSSQ